MTPLAEMLRGTPYASYTYSYPHKTAYRPLDPPVPLRDLWAGERRDALFLYLHIPFCEMRCGFCNLFTTVNPAGDFEADYLAALERQAARVRDALGPSRVARLAIGGGTPTYLTPAAIDRLFDVAEGMFDADPRAIPVSVETSPHTAEPEKLRLLRERGVDRVSIGVQSFVEAEVRAAGRPQRTADVEAALERIREAGFPTLNIDLMYGLPGQTVESWLLSLRAALRHAPEELYLYPLYVRPLTGLGRHPRGSATHEGHEGGCDGTDKEWDNLRLACYRAGRDFLLEEGYTQVSMRMFRAPRAPDPDGPVYCCQEDGMVGLGCGARSYTRELHYASEYAVGARLDAGEQRRRHAIQSLLQADGLPFDAYRARFGAGPLDDLPALAELVEHGLARVNDGLLALTAAGLERSDTIGPWLYSAPMRKLMEGYQLR